MANKVNTTIPKSQSSNISSLINSFNTNSITNNNKSDDDDDDNKTVASTRTNVSNISSQLNKAFTINNQEDDKTIVNERKEEKEDLVVAESNVKPSAFKNGIFNSDARKGEDKKLTRSATLPDLCKDAQEENKPVKKGSVASPFKENTTDGTSSPTPGLIFNKKKQPPPIPQKPKKLNDVKTQNDNVSPFDDQFTVN
jgi:hypothetical protein